MKISEKILVMLSVVLVSCSGNINNSADNTDEAVVIDTSLSSTGPMKFEGDVTVGLFRTDTIPGGVANGWGYNLYLNGKLTIHQPHIPAVPGMMPFQSEHDAGAVSELVVYKIRNNIMPPSVSIDELDSIGIKH